MIAALAGCKDRQAPPAGAPGSTARPGDAAVADADLDACRAAAARAPGLPATRRAQALIDGCRPCGDWQPLLMWNTPVTSGGPTRAAIEAAMTACRAYCTPSAKQRFLNTLDNARGQSTRGPWRHLGELCKAEVSAVPDARFMGAPYFALDRIARALGEAGGPGGPGGPGGHGDPALLAAIELPLPALSVSGVGLDLPELPAALPAPTAALPTPPAAAATGAAGPAALTVDAAQVLLGALPIAHLSPTGITVAGDYPGAPIALAGLAAALPAAPIVLLAPRALPAARIAQVVAAAGGHDLRLAVAAPGPGGWEVPAALPVALTAPPRKPSGSAAATPTPTSIALVPTATAEDLARRLAEVAATGATSVVLVVAAAPPGSQPPAAKP